MSPQQPLQRRWELFRSAIPRSPIYPWSSMMTSGQRRRTSAAVRGKPTVLRRGLGRSRSANKDLLKGGLGPFVDREFKSAYKDRAAAEASRFMGEVRLNTQ